MLLSLGLDAAGVNLLNGLRTLRNAIAVRSFGTGMAHRAGQLAGTRTSLQVARLAYAARSQGSDQLLLGTLQVVGRVPNAALAPAPFEAPAWYNVLRNIPVLGTGIRLGETAHVCLGNL
jgi:hypothetical protein